MQHDSFSVSVVFVSFAAGTFRDLPLSRKAFGPPSWSMPGLLTPYSHTIFHLPFRFWWYDLALGLRWRCKDRTDPDVLLRSLLGFWGAFGYYVSALVYCW